jgi:hypothetical protein
MPRFTFKTGSTVLQCYMLQFLEYEMIKTPNWLVKSTANLVFP